MSQENIPERSRKALSRSKLNMFDQQLDGQCVSSMVSTVNRT